MTSLLATEKLSAGYGKISAITDIDLSVSSGCIVSVVGPNGAGKSTFLNVLSGLHPASSGTVTFDGQDVSKLPPEQRLKRGLCIVPEKRELFSSMSVLENLELGAYIYRGEGRASLKRSLDEVFTRFPRLGERRTQLARTLSGGERQMLALGRALMSRPKLLLLDEPSLGLAPRIIEEVFRIIVDLKQNGVSILLVEQNARSALAISDYGYVLETGSVVLQGPSQVLTRDPRIIETYLGSSREEAVA
jgi:branched-chain amino acid transport system ATP-binding protein